jgi:hypothetical protein
MKSRLFARQTHSEAAVYEETRVCRGARDGTGIIDTDSH